MKSNIIHFSIAIIFIAILLLPNAMAQQGMDYAGGGATHFSRLRRHQGGGVLNSFLQNINNEKAMGVYTAEIFPSAMLEVNTTTGYSPLMHFNLQNDRGRVFRTAAPSGFTQQWQMFRDNTLVARLFNDVTNNNDFHIEASAGSFVINTNSPQGIEQRIQVMGVTHPTTGQNTTRVGISHNGAFPIVDPLALLHLGSPWPFNTGGHRPWMDDGIYINSRHLGMGNAPQSDNMYIGLRNINTDINEAIINWGNNPIGSGADDRLRFVFTANGTSGFVASGFDGLEIARMVSNGNTGRMGIGDFFTPVLDPLSTLDVRGNAVVGTTYAGTLIAPTNGMLIQGFTGIGPSFTTTNQPARQLDVFNITAPQLRLTQSLGTVSHYTDFQTTSSGNLRIIASDGICAFTIPPPSYAACGFVGINTVGEPNNTVEISSSTISPTRSGLRFTNLNNSLAVDGNGNGKVLSVNNVGDVILVNDAGGSSGNGFGQCNILPTLSNNSGVNLFNHNLFFDGTGTAFTNQIGIGLACTTTPLAKVHVINSNATNSNVVPASNISTAGLFDNTSTDAGTANSALNTGVQGKATGPVNPASNSASLSMNVGVWGQADSNAMNIGVLGIAGAMSPNSLNGGGTFQGSIGGQFASTKSNNYKNFGVATGASGATFLNYGIYSSAPACPTCINGTGANYAGFFSGSVFATGPITSGSDSILKENIDSIPNALQIISQLKPHTFNFITSQYPSLNLPFGKQYGLTAQEVETVLPELVSFGIQPQEVDTDGTELSPNIVLKGINYTGLIPITIQAVKELDSIVAQFSPLISPDVPVLISPLNGATNLPVNNLTFSWYRAPGAILNFVQISRDSLFSDNNDLKFSGADTTMSVSYLNSNTTYYWRVQTYKASGVPAISEIRNFTTEPLLAPTLVAPANGDTGISVTSSVPFVWNSASGASYYKIDLSDDSAFSSYNKSNFSTFANDTTIALSVSNYNTLYFWRVSSFNGNGQSITSGVWHFTTQPSAVTPPAPIAPATAVSFNSSSDSIFKTNIAPITNALSKVTQLNGIYYDWLHNNPQYQFDSTQQIGFIAQSVQPIIPQVVHTGINGFLTVDYGRLVPVIVEAMKQQQQTIASQQSAIDSLQTALSGLQQSSPDSEITAIQQQLSTIQNCIDNLPNGLGCNGSAKMSNPDGNQQKTTIKEVVLKGEIILDQNNPNPFKESTTISYFIPDYIHFAQIIFSDNSGRIIYTVDIDNTGHGQLNVKAEKLGSGMYSYSIVVDGKTIDTKKMIKTK